MSSPILLYYAKHCKEQAEIDFNIIKETYVFKPRERRKKQDKKVSINAKWYGNKKGFK